jgi:hypothetical protein
MFTSKIFCLGDGYAHGHIWPEWPQILQALMPRSQIVTGTGIGAGNEFLIDQLLNFDCQNQTVIFQWAQILRFDKLLQDDAWNELINTDTVYCENKIQNASGVWWLSSASQQNEVRKYHEFFVQSHQQKLRFQHQQILVENFLQNQNCNYWFTSTKDQENFCRDHSQAHLRGSQIQPSPIMHFYFVVEKIKPALGLNINENLQKKLQDCIEKTIWLPYNPDRQDIWEQICANL